MTKSVTFSIISGLPFSKTVIITLPTERDWWTSAEEFEIRAQVREKPDVSSKLVLDLVDYITVTFDGVDEVSASLQMTGEDTRNITRSGFYDIIISDPGVIDQRAYKLVQGPVRTSPLITSA